MAFPNNKTTAKRKAKPKSGDGTSMKLGGGGRFDQCVKDNQDKDDPSAFCAAAGRKTYGKKGMAALASKGTGGAKTALAFKNKKGK